MTKKEIANIASKMDESTKLLIDKEVAERLEILKEGDLSEDELSEMEECLYASLILEEFLNGEYELLEEERQALFDEMEEMYNRYSDLLVRARIEEKVGKKKRMTLELMKIRERLMERKQDYKNIKKQMKNNREQYKKLEDLTKKSTIQDLAKKNREYNKQQGRGKNYKPAKEKGSLIGGLGDALSAGNGKLGGKTKEEDKATTNKKNDLKITNEILKKAQDEVHSGRLPPLKDYVKENREAQSGVPSTPVTNNPKQEADIKNYEPTSPIASHGQYTTIKK